jgi:putative glutamine amidotransferase
MTRPVVGITCHAFAGSIPRSALVQMYVDALDGAGGASIGIPLGLSLESLERVYSVLDGILLPGGDDVGPERYGHGRHPNLGAVDANRDELEITVASWALRDDKPVLGICRGIQVLAVAAGGTLYQDLQSEWSGARAHDVREFGTEFLSHSISVQAGTILYRAMGRASVAVNSLHHQAVRDVPSGFIVSARSDDGVVEGIEMPEQRFMVGVQCHPERIWDTTAPEFKRLFESFVEAAESDSR